jgi:4,5-DOPA dioxygenase extradiol
MDDPPAPTSRRSRRDVLQAGARAAAAAGLGLLAARCGRPEPSPDPRPHAPAPPPAPSRAPVVYVGHGSPMSALDAASGGAWQRWGARWPRLRGVLAVSAHWENFPTTIGATSEVPLVYDMYGFPDALYEVKYPAPGAPDLAKRVRALLAPLGEVAEEPDRGLDHGVWVPLKWLLPAADVPVLEISMVTEDAAPLFALGRALAPLRDEGVAILCSGNLVHHLGARPEQPGKIPAWATDHDAWWADVLARRDVDAIVDLRRKAPALREAHPTREHLVPILVAAGAASPAWRATTFPVTGFEGAGISRRCVEFS